MLSLRKLSVVVVVLLSFAFFSGIAYAAPKIKFNKMIHDFGEIEQMTSNKYKFTFKNIGDEELVIKKVKPSCGCTATLVSSDTLKPGESGEIEVTFNSGKFKNKVKKTIYVETNEPLFPGDEKVRMDKDKEPTTRVHKLYLTAKVKYDKKKEEALKKARREFQMKKSKERQENLKKAEGASKQLSRKGVSRQTSKITVPKEVQMAVAKTLKVDNSISFHPKSLTLGEIELNKEYKRPVKIINMTKDKVFNIVKVEVSVPFVATMINKMAILPNNPGQIEVIVNVKRAGELKKGNIFIYIKGKAQPLSIPISWKSEEEA